MAAINLRDAIHLVQSEWVHLRCITANLNKNTGGQLLEFQACRVARKKNLLESNIATNSQSGDQKATNHNHNFTLNLELKNGQIRKIHPLLITHINNLPVL